MVHGFSMVQEHAPQPDCFYPVAGFAAGPSEAYFPCFRLWQLVLQEPRLDLRRLHLDHGWAGGAHRPEFEPLRSRSPAGARRPTTAIPAVGRFWSTHHDRTWLPDLGIARLLPDVVDI